MSKSAHILLIIITLAILSACAPTAAAPPTPTEDVSHGEAPIEQTDTSRGETPSPADVFPKPVKSAIDLLADAQTVNPENIEVIKYEEYSWPTSCLGLAEPGEMCLQVITPGWRIELRADGETYIYHTDKSGDSIRRAMAPFQVETPLSDPQPRGDGAQPVQAAIQILGQELDLDLEQIEVVSALPTTWTDSCLGLGGPQESCLQIMTPGWQVILSAQGKQYVLHTDEDGNSVRLQPVPLLQLPTVKPDE